MKKNSTPVRQTERKERASQKPIVPGLPDAPGIRAAMLITPKLREHLNGIAQTLLVDPFPDSTLTRFEKEILATAVSASNNCFYCMDCHAEFAIAVCELEKNSEEAEEITESIKTGSTDKLSEKMQKLVIIAKNVKELARNYEKEKKDVEAALKAGATAGDVQLAVAIAAAFCMYNRFVEGFRAQTFDSFAIYKERAKIIAKDGYTNLPK